MVFTYIFFFECLLKLIAYRKVYFSTNWNIFDFTIVLTSLVGTLFDFEIRSQVSVIRIFRVGRIFRLVQKAKRLNTMFNSFVHTIPTFVNVFSLIMIMIFIFAIIGNRIFSGVKLSGVLNRHNNF